MPYIKRIIFFILFFNAVYTTAFADIYLEEKITTTVAGRPFNGIKKIYIAKNKTLLEDPTISKRIIYDYNAGKVYLIDDVKKDVSIYGLNNFALPINEKIYPDIVSVKEEEILSKESSGKKKIGKYNCSEIVIFIPRIATLSHVWVTKEIDVPLESLYSFLENNGNNMLKKILPALKNGKAYVVESVTTIVRPKEAEKNVKSELKKISVQEVPETLFTLPEDYRKLNMETASSVDPGNTSQNPSNK
jgi:hypothetical protein